MASLLSSISALVWWCRCAPDPDDAYAAIEPGSIADALMRLPSAVAAAEPPPIVDVLACAPDAAEAVIRHLLAADPGAALALFRSCRAMRRLGIRICFARSDFLVEHGDPTALGERAPSVAIAHALARCGDEKRTRAAVVSLYMAFVCAKSYVRHSGDLERSCASSNVSWRLVGTGTTGQIVSQAVLRRNTLHFKFADVRRVDKRGRPLPYTTVVPLKGDEVEMRNEKGELYVLLTGFRKPRGVALLPRPAAPTDGNDGDDARAKRFARVVRLDRRLLRECSEHVMRAVKQMVRQRRHHQDPIAWLNLRLIAVLDDEDRVLVYARLDATRQLCRFERVVPVTPDRLP